MNSINAVFVAMWWKLLHSIRFIEVLTKDQVLRAELVPGQKPVAEFRIKQEDVVGVREYCNLHGLWKVSL